MPFSARDAAGVTRAFDAAGDGVAAPFRPRRAVLDGDDAALGATTDAAVVSAGAAGSVVALLKGLLATLGSAPAVTVADSSPSFSTSAVVVGGEAVRAAAAPGALSSGVMVKASRDNPGRVYVGASPAVTAGTNPATDGYELGAGEAVFIGVNDPYKVWLVATASTQKVYLLGV